MRLNPDRLQAVPGLLDRYLDQRKLPGYACLISQGGEEVSYFEGGYRDVERGVTMTRDTIFRIYSMTKPLTSVAVMQLVEQGLIQLDDPASRYLPGLSRLRVYEEGTSSNLTTSSLARPISIKDLLTHTAGLTYGFQHQHVVDELYRENEIDSTLNRYTAAQILERLTDIPLQFQPGSRWNYSVATDVLGHLVEVVSDQSLDQYLERNITTPLGMGSTAFSLSEKQLNGEQAERFAACYGAIPEAGPDGRLYVLQDDPATSPWREPPKFLSGGGGLVSTIDDYHQFCLAMQSGGVMNDTRILGARTVEFMTSNHLPGGVDLKAMGQSVFSETPMEGIGFGLGFSVVIDPPATSVLCSRGEYGWGGLASTTFWIDPQEEIIAIFMTQLIPSSTWPIRRQLRNAIYQALE